MPRASSQPLTKPGRFEDRLGLGRVVADQPLGEGYQLLAHPVGDAEERFRPVAVLLSPAPGAAPLLGLAEAPLGVGELLLQRAGVEVLGRDRLLDQQPRPVAEHLQPAVRLGVAPRLGLGDVEPQLGRPQRRQQRRVVGEDADLADRGPGRDLAHLAAADLPLRGEDLDVEAVLAGQAGLLGGRAPRRRPRSPGRSSPSCRRRPPAGRRARRRGSRGSRAPSRRPARTRRCGR